MMAGACGATEALAIQVEICDTQPDYMPLARGLVDPIRAFFEDPENEAAFQAWMAERGESA